jgi:WD40 repeat protein
MTKPTRLRYWLGPLCTVWAWPEAVKNSLWGYDFFISYHWSSGGTYAVNLAAKLREHGYDVFLDRSEYAMGDKWKSVGELALRNTQRLVLIATREALFESKPVEHEVIIFTDRGRHCIPIFFETTFLAEREDPSGKCLVLNRLPSDTLYILDSIVNLALGPADGVVETLTATHSIMRRRKLRQTIILIIASLLALLAAFATISWFNTARARNQLARQLTEVLYDTGLQHLTQGRLDLGVSFLTRALNNANSNHPTVVRGLSRHLDAWRLDIGVRLEAGSPIAFVAFDDKDSSVLISTGGNHRVFDRATGMLRETLNAEEAMFSVDCKWLITHRPAGSSTLWAVHSVNPSAATFASGQQRSLLDVSPDHTLALVQSTDRNSVEIWNLLDGTIQQTPIRHGTQIVHGHWSRDQQVFFTQSVVDDTALIRIWNRSDMTPTRPSIECHGNVQLATFADQEGYLAKDKRIDKCTLITVSTEGEITYWEVYSARSHRADWIVSDLSGREQLKLVSSDGQILVSEYRDQPRAQVVCRNLFSGKERSVSARQAPLVSCAFNTPFPRLLLLGFSDSSAQLLECDSFVDDIRLTPVANISHDGVVQAVAFGLDYGDGYRGQLFLTATRFEVQVWASATAGRVGRPIRVDYPIQSTGFTPDGRFIFVVSGDVVRIRPADVTEMSIVKSDEVPVRQRIHVAKQAAFSSNSICCVSDDGQYVVTNEPSKSEVSRTLKLWKADGQLVASTTLTIDKSSQVDIIQISSNAAAIALSQGKGIQIWNRKSNSVQQISLGASAVVSGLAFDPTGTKLMVGHDDGTCSVVRSPFQIAESSSIKLSEKINCLQFSSNGKILLTVGPTLIQLWEAQSSKSMGFNVSHELPEVTVATFSPDSEIIAAAGGSVARFFDVATRRSLGPPMQHLHHRFEEKITAIEFMQNGRLFCCQGYLRYIWRVPLDVPSDARDGGRAQRYLSR